MTEFRIISLKRPDSEVLTYVVQRKKFWWWKPEPMVESGGKKQPFEFPSPADAERYILGRVHKSDAVGGTIAHYVV